MKKIINKESLISNYAINPNLFSQYEVHRGLRKPNGTGVLCGLNRIGDVHGYELINGVKTAIPGILYYRGINMADIASAALKEKRYGFEEIIYLLMLGNLPTRGQLNMFINDLHARQTLNIDFLKILIKTTNPNTNIMNKLAQSVLGLYAYDENPDAQDLETVLNQCLDLITRLPILLTHIYKSKHEKSVRIRLPKPTLSFAENFLYMLRPSGKFSKLEARILDLALMLHAEHGGGNNSTFSVHVVSSTGTDTYSAISTAIGSLKGSKHGGANSEVLKMMHEIKSNVKDWTDENEIKAYLEKIIKKEASDKSGLIYGMGHAIYTITDPRAEIFKDQAKLLAKAKGQESEMNLYLLISKLAPQVFAEVKKSDKLICANIDFFTGFIYEMLKIPEELCTPIFATSRIVGWCAHRIDELINGGKIIRPAYKDVSDRKNYIPMNEREGDV